MVGRTGVCAQPLCSAFFGQTSVCPYGKGNVIQTFVGAHRRVPNHCAVLSSGRHIGLPLRKMTIRHKNRKTNKCRGAPVCAPCHCAVLSSGRHIGLPLRKITIRQKNRKTNKCRGVIGVCAQPLCGTFFGQTHRSAPTGNLKQPFPIITHLINKIFTKRYGYLQEKQYLCGRILST